MPQTLAAMIRAKYPGAYDDLSDVALESQVKAKYPGVYDDLPSSGAIGAHPEAKMSASSGGNGVAFAGDPDSVTLGDLMHDPVDAMQKIGAAVKRDVTDPKLWASIALGYFGPKAADVVVPAVANAARATMRGGMAAAQSAPELVGIASPRIGNALKVARNVGQAVLQGEPEPVAPPQPAAAPAPAETPRELTARVRAEYRAANPMPAAAKAKSIAQLGAVEDAHAEGIKADIRRFQSEGDLEEAAQSQRALDAHRAERLNAPATGPAVTKGTPLEDAHAEAIKADIRRFTQEGDLEEAAASQRALESHRAERQATAPQTAPAAAPAASVAPQAATVASAPYNPTVARQQVVEAFKALGETPKPVEVANATAMAKFKPVEQAVADIIAKRPPMSPAEELAAKFNARHKQLSPLEQLQQDLLQGGAAEAEFARKYAASHK